MLYSTIKSRFDTAPVPHEITWELMGDIIKNPPRYNEKDQIPLWRFVTLNGNPGRKDDAYQDVTAVTMEFDDGKTSIKDFVSKYKTKKFILYTTPSHSPTINRFRVIFPLAAPVPFADAKLVRDRLNKFFVGCDESSMSNWQRMPGMVLFGSVYQHYINDAPGRLDLRQLIKRAKYARAADMGLLEAKKHQEAAQIARSGVGTGWTVGRQKAYCEDKLGPKLRDLVLQIPLRSGRHQAIMNFITYMAALTWPGTDIKIYSGRDAYEWLRPWFQIGDRAVEVKINNMIRRFFDRK